MNEQQIPNPYFDPFFVFIGIMYVTAFLAFSTTLIVYFAVLPVVVSVGCGVFVCALMFAEMGNICARQWAHHP